MIGHVEQLPQSIEDAVNLGKLTLEMTNALLTAEVIPLLGNLPSLHTLRLRVSKDQQHGELQFPTALFSKLQVLEIACKSKLHVRFDEGAIEKLELLKVHCLEGSEMQFLALEHPAGFPQASMASGFLWRRTQGSSPAAACQAPEETCSEAGGPPATFIPGVEIVIRLALVSSITYCSCTARTTGAARSL